jgi:hypothetical protein
MPDASAINTQGVAYQGVSDSFDINSMSLEDLMFFVMSERSEALDNAVRGYADQIQRRNDLMKQTNQVLSEVRFLSANLESGETATMTPEMAQFFAANGITLPNQTDAASSSLTVDQKAERAQAIIDWLNNDKPYTDDACVDADLSPEMINYARSIGIEPKDDGDGAGQNWESSDFASFKSEVEQKLLTLQEQQATQASGGTADTSPSANATGGTYTKEEWDSIISSVQGFQEGLNNESQLDMIKFQSLMSKYTTSIEMLSNVMKKLSDNASAIVRNI